MKATEQTKQTEGPKKVLKCAKEIEGAVIKISIEGRPEKIYDFATLPKDIRAKLGPFGLGHKLGDAAAGKSGKEAEEAIDKVWEGLASGDWTVRAPAAPKLTKKAIGEKLEGMSSDEAEAARALLEKLGLKI